MWFKNLKFFKFSKPFQINTAVLQTQLKQMSFRACGAQEIQTYGFVPLLPTSELLFYEVGSAIAYCLQTEQKILPASVVNAALTEKIMAIEKETGRQISKKAKKELKEETIFALLPKAFTKKSHLKALFLEQEQILVVDTSSDKQAEVLFSCLRKCLDSFPVIPLAKANDQIMLTKWVQGGCPAEFEILNEAELNASAKDGGTIKIKNETVMSEEVLAHVTAGKLVTKLAVNFNERFTCLISDDYSCRRLKYANAVKEQSGDISDADLAAKFDADFTIFAAEIREFVNKINTLMTNNKAN